MPVKLRCFPVLPTTVVNQLPRSTTSLITPDPTEGSPLVMGPASKGLALAARWGVLPLDQASLRPHHISHPIWTCHCEAQLTQTVRVWQSWVP